MIGFLLVVFWDKIPFLKGEGHAVRLTFLLVGLWWIGFAQIPFKYLPVGNAISAKISERKNFITGGFKELRKVFLQMMKMPVLKRFLFAFFFYNMGVQTVMLAATNFGSKVFNLPPTNLIITIVLIQIVAIAGAHLMAKLSSLYGNFKVLIGIVIFWILICIAAYLMTSEYHFYGLAIGVGLVMGGIQALSRSTYSKLMPVTEDTASFFSFYDVTEKIAIVIGLTAFGFIEELTNDMRNSVLSLITFFTLGLILLLSALYKQNKISAAK
jgi:UMF1 family MFS transporter